MENACVSAFTHLENKYNAAQALHLLKRVASLVKPLMTKRSWVLPLLSEFFPDNPKLQGLNVNAGQQILLRLRPAHDSDTLIREEVVVQTMLHELTHNVHGEHNVAFYKYLTALQDEYSDLVRLGHDGDGFLSTGRMLVSSPYEDINVPSNVTRVRALEAAQRRANALRIVSTSGRLGGRSGANELSRRELIAQAAERRLKDDQSCGAGAEINVQAEIEKANKNNVKAQANETQDIGAPRKDSEIHHDDRAALPTDNAEDITIALPRISQVTSPTMESTLKEDITEGLTPHDKYNSKADAEMPNSPGLVLEATRSTSKDRTHFPQPRQRSSMPLLSGSSRGSRVRVPFISQEAYSTLDQRPPADWRWPCSACKAKNEASAPVCSACATPMAQVKWYEKGGWTCTACAQGGISQRLWTCIWCGEMKFPNRLTDSVSRNV